MGRPDDPSSAFGARTGHLATVRPDGRPHIVVVTFAIARDAIVTAIDHKPKRSSRLQRLVNIEADPHVSFLVDHYEEDWGRLWWVRVDGEATIHRSGEIREGALTALVEKYAQYRERRPEGPVIAITRETVTSWASTP
jgi:PPOX class probable F420-dependent enzyme